MKGDGADTTIGPAAIARDIATISGLEAVTSILDVVCRVTGMGFAAVARVTDTHWTACAVRDVIGFGLVAGGELPLNTTLCDEIRGHRQPIIIDDVAADARYAQHHTPRLYGLQSYISYPIILADGEMFGTLCAIDPGPNVVSSVEVTETFRLFAQLIAFHLDAANRVAISEAALLDAEAVAVLRDQFIAVLGHDLRNPLAAIQAGSALLNKTAADDRSRTLIRQMQDSAQRMERLIADVLDFARGRLGGGIALAPLHETALQAVITKVVDEIRTAWPGREIIARIAISHPVACDPERIGQLLSNLLANALQHGATDTPVEVEAHDGPQGFELSVANTGPAIPPDALPQLFQPFKRHEGGGPQEGLGLGLYIAAQIAKGHNGSLDVTSDTDQTRFRFVMPASPRA